MNRNNTDVFVLQILVSNLSLINPPRVNDYANKVIAPLINIKIQDGPNVLIPFLSKESVEEHLEKVRSGHKHPPIEVEESIMKGGKFNFEKGKSCLFTTNFIKRQSIKLQIEVMDGMIFPPTTIATSEVLERTFDPESLHIQTLLKGNVVMFDDKKLKYGFLSLVVTLQSIGNFQSSTDFNESSKASLKQPTNTKENAYLLPNENNYLQSENYSIEEDSSDGDLVWRGKMLNVKNKEVGKERKSDQHHRHHEVKNVKTLNETPSSKENKTKSPNRASTTVKKREKRIPKLSKIAVNDRTKGWLRSTPVYKGNMSKAQFPSLNTRTTFFRLSKMYPDIEIHLRKEVEKQIKEKAQQLDKKVEEEIYRQKSNYLRLRLRSKKSKLQNTTDNNYQIKKTVALQTPEQHFEDKETRIGISLLEASSPPSTPTFEDHDYQSAEESSRSESVISSKIYPKFKQQESIQKNEKQGIHFKSSKISSGNIKKRSLNEQENILNLTKQSGIIYTTNLMNSDNNYQSESKSSIKEDLLENSKMDESISPSQISENITEEETPPFVKVLAEDTKIDKESNQSEGSFKNTHSSEGKSPLESDPNALSRSPKVKALTNVLIHQNSKTSSSVYPQSSEDKLRGELLSPVPQSPLGIDDVESTISNISERIAKVLMPKENKFPSIHTDSISSFVPSNLSDAYSSFSDISS